MKAELKAMNSKLNNKEEQINDLQDRIMEIPQSEGQNERQIKKKKWKQFKRPVDSIKHTNVHLRDIQNGTEW